MPVVNAILYTLQCIESRSHIKCSCYKKEIFKNLLRSEIGFILTLYVHMCIYFADFGQEDSKVKCTAREDTVTWVMTNFF